MDGTSPFDMQDAVVERYVYDDIHDGVASADGGNVVLDFVDADGPGGSGRIALTKRYLWGQQVDQLLSQEDVTKNLSATDRVLWPDVDHLQTVRDLVKQDGTVATHFVYDAYGQVISGDTSLTRYLFTSRELDTATGYQYNRARWYDSGVRRWMNEDPVGFVAGDGNVARYVGNGVSESGDASGLQEPGVEARADALMRLVRESIRRTGPHRVRAIPGVIIHDDGPLGGTPKRAWGKGEHIAIRGERDNPLFGDYQVPPGYEPSVIKGYERPFTTDLPSGSVSHVIIRSSPVGPEEWKEIIRLKQDFAVVTIAGTKEAIDPIYRGIVKGDVLKNAVQITEPRKVHFPLRTSPNGRYVGDSPLLMTVISVLLGPNTTIKGG